MNLGLLNSEMLYGSCWSFATDFKGQTNGSTFKGDVDFVIVESVTDTPSRNVGNKLSIYTTEHSSETKVSITPLLKPEIYFGFNLRGYTSSYWL